MTRQGEAMKLERRTNGPGTHCGCFSRRGRPSDGSGRERVRGVYRSGDADVRGGLLPHGDHREQRHAALGQAWSLGDDPGELSQHPQRHQEGPVQHRVRLLRSQRSHPFNPTGEDHLCHPSGWPDHLNQGAGVVEVPVCCRGLGNFSRAQRSVRDTSKGRLLQGCVCGTPTSRLLNSLS